MAKLNFIPIVESAHGKVCGNSNVSYRNSYGCNHTYTWNQDTKLRLTPLRHLQQEVMRQANVAASAILADEGQTALWKQRFQAQSHYHYFRPFIVAMKMAEIKEGLKGEKA